MQNWFKNLNWLKLAKITTWLMVGNLIFIFIVGAFKYWTYKYTGLDLAIYNQVFYNTSLGRFFEFTIHPTSYLGDHFELIILLLAPFYSIYRSPLTLNLLQAIFLITAAIPLFLIAKKYLSQQTSLLVIILYLFNPITLNMALFEFHILAIAPFFLLWTFYFYDKNNFRLFLVFSGLCLIIREDLAFAIFMLGILSLLDRKKLYWFLTPCLLSVAYFLMALKIVAHFSASSGYKFLIYYQWLGNSLPEIALNFFLKFPQVLLHFISITNFELLLGLFLLFLFIPLYRPKYFLIGLGSLLQIFLGFASGELILRTHYSAIFLPSLAIATIFSIKALSTDQKALKFYAKNKHLILLILVVALLYNFFVLGPVIPFVKTVFSTDYNEVILKQTFAKEIEPTASVVTTYDFITQLSGRPKIYSLNYAFLNRQQYAAGEYKIPPDTEYLLINFSDFVTFDLQYRNYQNTKDYYWRGSENLRKLLADSNWQLIKIEKNLGLWKKNANPTDLTLYSLPESLPAINLSGKTTLANDLELVGSQKQDKKTELYFKALQKIESNYFIKIDNKIYPLGYGFYPTKDWEVGQLVQINFFGLSNPETFQIITFDGGLELKGIGEVLEVFDQINILGEFTLN